MVAFNNNNLSDDGKESLLEAAGPNDRLIFSVVPKDENGVEVGSEFAPEYYPERFNKIMEKDLNRDGQQCRGEDVTIETFKNADVHAKGECFAQNVSVLEDLHAHDGKVELYTPISPNGGLEAFVKKVEIGEISGWNPHFNQWMFNYTLDFVSTGLDEYGGNEKNGLVSTLLEENQYDSAGNEGGFSLHYE